MAVNQDWKKRAKALGVLEQFSPEQLKLAEADPDYGWATTSNKAGYAAARTPEEKAMYHAQQQEANAAKGFSGGTDGSLYSLMPTTMEANAARDAVKGYGDFTYSREPDYQGALNAVIDREAFSYDPETDPVYSSYRKTYAREGRRAGEDALGQYAAMTGGRPSTAAMTAAQQAGNYYSAQMADKIPELYQQAYQRYLNEYAMRLQGLDALRQDYSREYGRYGDKYDRLTDYYGIAANEDAAARNRVDRAEQTAYQRRLSEDETAYDRARQARLDAADREDAAYARALNGAKLGMSVGDYSGLERLGITPDWNAVLNAELASQGRTVPVGSGTGTRTSAASDYGAADRKWAQSVLSAAAQGKVDRNSEAYILAREILFGVPVPGPEGQGGETVPGEQTGEEQAPGSPKYLEMTRVMEDMLAAGRTPKERRIELDAELRDENLTRQEYDDLRSRYVDAYLELPERFASRAEARDWLLAAGLPGNIAGRVPDEAEWKREREKPGSDASAYGSYGAYLTAYARYLLEQYGG